jgi:hypothetical protein
MKTTLTFKYYTDPSHGWVAVKRELLHTLNIADKVSYYSYQKGKTVYLEEDCDYSLLINALKEQGIELNIEERHTNNNSPIRSYERYSA